MQINKFEIDETFSKIYGAIVADGTVYIQNKKFRGHKYKSYYIEIADGWLKNVIDVKNWICNYINEEKGYISKIKDKNAYRYRVGCRRLVNFLISLGHPVLSKHDFIIPKEIINKKKNRRSFLCAFIMFEGCVKLDGVIEISTISEALRDATIEMLQKEGIRYTVSLRKFERWSENTKYIITSHDKIKFLDILEGPKLERLKVILGRQSNYNVFELFHEQKGSKLSLKFLYDIIGNECITVKDLKNTIDTERGKIGRNTMWPYINILKNSNLIEKIGKGRYRRIKNG
jgi:hypothetical protein